MFTSTVFTALLCTSIGLVDARVVQRDVVSPPITYPTAGTVWNVNERHNVTWDTSVIPPGTNNTGMIVLGFLDASDPFNEHLDLNDPLATGFPITAGRADIIVPSVTTRNSYILVLFGDSGNASPKFTINNISITTSSPSVASTVASSSASSPALASTTEAQQAASSAGLSIASTSMAVSSAANISVPGPVATPSVQASPASSSVASSAASSTPAAQGTPTSAQSATSSNAGVRSASYGGAAAWISTICSLALVVGISL